jgi:MFS family permease
MLRASRLVCWVQLLHNELPAYMLAALCALPTAFIADYTEGRVWVLTIAALWWSLCVLFQGLAHNFRQILLARIGMGIGQAPVEALSISLISDMVTPKWLFLSERCDCLARR